MAKATSASTIATSFSIPPRPDSLIKISTEMKKDYPNPKVIAEALKADVTLYGTLLKVINSPLFALRNKVTSVDNALMLLGMPKVYSLVRVTALKNALDREPRLDRFWDTASEVATLATKLSGYLTGIESEDAYTAGMFHDCGIPLMMQQYPDFKELLYRVNSNPNLTFSYEQDVCYGVNHYDVGYELTKTWLLPEAICETIKTQPLYADALTGKLSTSEHTQTLLAVVVLAKHISNAFRKMWRIEDKRLEALPSQEVLDYLGLSEIDFLEIKDKCLEDLESQET
ncbi:MAG: HDOD domain-containing protein [Motiliproteus sp.]|nr:HDOD domain-containing protein [Motiliproteus sp.]